jgi:hypothetical protein
LSGAFCLEDGQIAPTSIFATAELTAWAGRHARRAQGQGKVPSQDSAHPMQEFEMRDVVIWQKLEGALVFIAALILSWQAGAGLSWWVAVLVFLAPDVSLAGYALGPKIGAVVYNLAHLYASGAVLLVAGTAFSIPMLIAVGALWLAHAGFDRMLGYGLKSAKGFHDTHLGPIGKAPKS